MMQSLPDALAPLSQYRQFICYSLTKNPDRPGKYIKKPVDHQTGRVADAHDPAIWTDATTAIAAAQRLGTDYGLGFVFTEDCGFWFLDIDNCRLPDNSDWTPLAHKVVGMFPGAAVEVSSSNKGLHIFGRGTVPAHSTKNSGLGLELYTDRRFCALVGLSVSGDASRDFTREMPAFVSTYFPPSTTNGVAADWTDGPCEPDAGVLGDDELIAKAMAKGSKQTASDVFGDGTPQVRASFADLWTANDVALSQAYPDTREDGTRAFDRSSADAALATRLAFWTGKDCERIKRLMYQSALVRDKYESHDYLARTITFACGKCEVYYKRKPAAEVQIAPTTSTLVGSGVESAPPGTQLWPADQLKFFHGCVYVSDIHRILVPGGMLLKPDQFRADFGGRMFVMDAANERRVRDPYEAFIESQVNRPPRADSTCFRPDREPAEIIRDAGRSRVNVWWPVDVPRAAGDPSPFLTHLAKLLPIARDREILLAYMCACVQYKGIKFQWAPLIQGVEGNGKTLFTRCVAESIGKRYVHLPKASKLAKQFNAWMLNKLFYGVEDIYVPDNQREVIEELKPMITGDDLEIEGKGVDQISADICGNFMFNSNHKDAIKKTRNDRRFAIFFTKQQESGDLIRDGLTEAYFATLYDWLKHDGGYAIVSELLHTMPIPDEFNPAKSCQRAPVTSSTSEAIEESLGGIEQEVREATRSGRQGFKNGWISSAYLDRFLKDTGRRLPLNKRKDMLLSIGYVPHPGLPDGRAPDMVAIDGERSILYVRHDHANRDIVGPAAIMSAYANAQLPGLGAPLPQGVK